MYALILDAKAAAGMPLTIDNNFIPTVPKTTTTSATATAVSTVPAPAVPTGASGGGSNRRVKKEVVQEIVLPDESALNVQDR